MTSSWTVGCTGNTAIQLEHLVRPTWDSWLGRGDKWRTSNLGSGATFAGTNHDEQFHDRVVDSGAAGLYNEDVLFSNTVEDLNARLALLQSNVAQLISLWDGSSNKGWVDQNERRTGWEKHLHSRIG